MAADSNIRIKRSEVEDFIEKQKNVINNDLLDVYVSGIDSIDSGLSESKGEFVCRLKEELMAEKELITEIAAMLITMGDYVLKATNDICDYDENRAANTKVNGE